MKSRSSNRKRLLQILVSVVLVILLLRLVDVPQVVEIFSNADFRWAALAVLLVVADQTFMGAKWNILLKALRVNVPVGVPIIAYLRGRAFKFLVPSTIGIDAYKTFYLKKYDENVSAIVSSIVVERFFGMLSSLLLVSLLLYFFAEPFGLVEAESLTAFSIGIAVVSIATLVLLISQIRSVAMLSVWSKLPNKIAGFIRPALSNLVLIHEQQAKLYSYVGLSVVEKLFYGLIIFACAKTIGTDQASVFYILAATPILALLERIPISVSAIGVREGLFVAMFSPFGVPTSQAIAIALVLRMVEIAQIILLISVWYIDPETKPSDAEIEPADNQMK